MPLIIHGARQVGKTYTALSFGKEHYKNTAYFNLEDSVEVTNIFERDLNPDPYMQFFVFDVDRNHVVISLQV